jgi:hypothetical protein
MASDPWFSFLGLRSGGQQDEIRMDSENSAVSRSRIPI